MTKPKYIKGEVVKTTRFEFLQDTFGMHRHVFKDGDGGTIICMGGRFDYWKTDRGTWYYQVAL